MPNFQEKGIYEGGIVTVGTGSDNFIYISPYILNLYSGLVTGAGEGLQAGVAKKIAVAFGGVAMNGLGTRDDTKAPNYAINVPPAGGSVWIYYDESKQDIAFSSAPLAGVVTFAKIQASATALSMAQISKDETYVAFPSNPNRTEALTAYVENPQSGKHLYYDGQAFIGGRLNKTLANMSIVTELFQEESLSSIGGKFFLTLLTQSDIVKASSTRLDIRPVRHYARESNYAYRTYNTKADPALGTDVAVSRTFPTPANLNGDNVYIVIHRVTGVVKIVLASETADYDLNTTHYLIARTVGPHDINAELTGVTSVVNLVFEIVNNSAGLNSIKEQIKSVVEGLHPSGAFKPFQVVGAGVNNKVSIPSIFGHIKGNIFSLQGGDITLSAPPSTSGTGRQDFIFIQLTKKRTPDIVLDVQVRVVDNISLGANPDPFTNTNVKALLDDGVTLGNTFTLTGDAYTSLGNPGTTEYFAIPLAVVARMNTSSYNSVTNPFGGGSRPDDKTAELINVDEILTTCPISSVVSSDKKELLDSAIEAVLRGGLRSKFDSLSGGVFSKAPLIEDTLASGSGFGNVDGQRRYWSGNPVKEVPMAFAIERVTGFTSEYGDWATPTLSLRVPNSYVEEAEVVIDNFGEPKDFRIQWLSDGTDVVMSGTWVPTFDAGFCVKVDKDIDVNDISFTSRTDPDERMVVSFKVRYVKPKPMSKVPTNIIKILNNLGVGKANFFVPATALDNNPRTYKVLDVGTSRSVVLGLNTYRDSLLIDRMGANVKGHAFILKYVMQGNAATVTPYIIPSSYTISEYPDFNGVYKLLSLLKVTDKNGNQLNVSLNIFNPSPTPQYEIKLSTPVSVNDPVYFHFGLDGSQIDLDYGSLEVSNITEAEEVTGGVIPASGDIFHRTAEAGLFEGHVIFGMSSFQSRMSLYVETSIVNQGYVQVPINASGFNTGLLKIDTTISEDLYNSLSATQKTCFNPTTFRLIAGRAYKFSVLRAKNQASTVNFFYTYGANPFKAFDVNTPAKFLDSGMLLLSTDGVANEGSSVYSPISERLPVVQDINVVGVETSSQTGLHPLGQFGHEGYLVAPNTDVVLDQRISYSVFVQEETGLAALFNIIEQNKKLLLFMYQARVGQLNLSNPDQAFVAELSNNMRII